MFCFKKVVVSESALKTYTGILQYLYVKIMQLEKGSLP